MLIELDLIGRQIQRLFLCSSIDFLVFGSMVKMNHYDNYLWYQVTTER